MGTLFLFTEVLQRECNIITQSIGFYFHHQAKSHLFAQPKVRLLLSHKQLHTRWISTKTPNWPCILILTLSLLSTQVKSLKKDTPEYLSKNTNYSKYYRKYRLHATKSSSGSPRLQLGIVIYESSIASQHQFYWAYFLVLPFYRLHQILLQKWTYVSNLEFLEREDKLWKESKYAF